MSTGFAVVVADDVTSLLQLSAGVRMSKGQRILAAVAKGDDTICVQAAAGDVAPVTGSFTARASQQAVMVAAGSVAAEAGSFCVSKQDVLLIQRTLGLNTAGDFEAALGSKKNKPTTTTTTVVWLEDGFDFKGSLKENVTVKVDGCPNVGAGLVQTVDASVSDKQQKKADKKKLDDNQLKVCGCRKFLKDSVNMPNFFESAGAAWKKTLEESGDTLLLQQRNFDAALASKKGKKAKKATTTTTTTTIDLTDTNLAEACTAGMEFLKDWTQIAKQLNNRAHADLYKELNITGGWQHCDKSWKVHGACRAYMTKEAVKEAADKKDAKEQAALEAALEQAAQEALDDASDKKVTADAAQEAAKTAQEAAKTAQVSKEAAEEKLADAPHEEEAAEEAKETAEAAKKAEEAAEKAKEAAADAKTAQEAAEKKAKDAAAKTLLGRKKAQEVAKKAEEAAKKAEEDAKKAVKDAEKKLADADDGADKTAAQEDLTTAKEVAEKAKKAAEKAKEAAKKAEEAV